MTSGCHGNMLRIYQTLLLYHSNSGIQFSIPNKNKCYNLIGQLEVFKSQVVLDSMYNLTWLGNAFSVSIQAIDYLGNN